MRRGIFIALEGIDGCGKDTQAKMLQATMQRTLDVPRVHMLHDPGDTPLAEECRRILKSPHIPMTSHEQLLLFTAARSSLSRYICELVESGDSVICTRWALSTIVYQGCLGELGSELVNAYHVAAGIIDPDVYLLLDIPVVVSKGRLATSDGGKDRFEKNGTDWFIKLRNHYKKQAVNLNIPVIPGTDTVEHVHGRVLLQCATSDMWPAAKMEEETRQVT